MKLNAEFIRLPYQFDAERMAFEVGQLSDVRWMEHPDKTDGNSALPLISCGGGDNDGFRGEMRPTPHLARSPYLQQVIASFGEVFGRSRLMRLDPGCEVREHVDYHYHWHTHVRIHIPVITTPEVIFHCGGAQLHMAAGECWIFDSWRRHRVVNAGQRARVHLVIDTAGSSRFWDAVDRSEQAMRAGTPLVNRFVGFEAGRPAPIVTERYNLQPVLSPAEIELLTYDLIAEFEAVPENDPGVAAEYRRVMLAFCRDWRALWYRYGIHKPGWPHYARLVAATRQALPEADPPLRVKNRMGLVKTTFGARILGVAVSPEVYEDFIAVPASRADAGEVAAAPAASAAERPSRLPAAAEGAAALEGARRNAPCPCGSGLRYKHCHGASRPAH